jgi:hypothetical protein
MKYVEEKSRVNAMWGGGGGVGYEFLPERKRSLSEESFSSVHGFLYLLLLWLIFPFFLFCPFMVNVHLCLSSLP